MRQTNKEERNMETKQTFNMGAILGEALGKVAASPPEACCPGRTCDECGGSGERYYGTCMTCVGAGLLHQAGREHDHDCETD